MKYIYYISILFVFISCKSNTSNNSDSMSLNSKELRTLFIGTYTSGDNSNGIYVYALNSNNGELHYLNSSKSTTNPSFIAIHPDKTCLYTVNETKEDSLNGSGRITAFKISPTDWELTPLNTLSSHGSYPCYISTDSKGDYCFAANYGGGNIAMHKIRNDGSLENTDTFVNFAGKGTHPNQDSPHAHMIFQASNTFIYSLDLGSDSIRIYTLDAAQDKLIKTGSNLGLESGTGPRHMDFHPSQAFAYILGELNGKIVVCKVNDKTGTLTPYQTISTLIGIENSDPSCADIHVAPNGDFLYASNRGDANTIAIYSINQSDGTLTFIKQQSTKGLTPRNFVIDPSGNFLLVANQNSNSVVVFRINKQTGVLTDTGNEIKVPNPVCLKFY